MRLHAGPGDSTILLVNEAAHRATGSWDYLALDRTTEVRILCRVDGWARVDLVSPEELANSYRGWVREADLEPTSTDAQGMRTFTADDVVWDDETLPRRFESSILPTLNRIERTLPECAGVDPSLAVYDGMRDGVATFSVGCLHDGRTTMIDFNERGDIARR